MGTDLKYATDKQIADFQSEALSRVSDSLDEWQRPSCMHSNYNCECKYKHDFFRVGVYDVASWTDKKLADGTSTDYDSCDNIRTDFTQYHPAIPATEEFTKASKEWWEDRMPSDVLRNKKASFLVIQNLRDVEAVSKIVSRAKKTVKECEKNNGYYLYDERLSFRFVADRDDIHLVMWFSEY